MTSPAEHRAFLNSYYGVSRHFYDVTRKYYLFGRDEENRALLREAWTSLVEIGPGTGRNLTKLHRARPHAEFGGLEASDEMLLHARKRCAFATFQQGFAEDTSASAILGKPVDRVLFSYCLSMCQNQGKALDRALAGLSQGGEVVVVDFGDFGDFLPPLAGGMRRFLGTFHVRPLDIEALAQRGAEITYGPARYFLRARLRQASSRASG